jgi:hypothetical protein
VKFRLLIYLVIIPMGLFINWVLNESVRVQDILILNIPQIAQKSYLTGCIDAGLNKAKCHEKSDHFRIGVEKAAGIKPEVAQEAFTSGDINEVFQ